MKELAAFDQDSIIEEPVNFAQGSMKKRNLYKKPLHRFKCPVQRLPVRIIYKLL